MSVENQRKVSSRLIWIGTLLLVLGSGPLITIMLFSELGITLITDDPDPNPVFFGMLAMLTFWPSIILLVIGLFVRYRNRKDNT